MLSPAGRRAEITAGDVSVRVDTATAEISLHRGDALLLRFPKDALTLGTVAALDDAVNYDPYRLHVPSALYVPPEITWHTVAGLTITKRCVDRGGTADPRWFYLVLASCTHFRSSSSPALVLSGFPRWADWGVMAAGAGRLHALPVVFGHWLSSKSRSSRSLVRRRAHSSSRSPAPSRAAGARCRSSSSPPRRAPPPLAAALGRYAKGL